MPFDIATGTYTEATALQPLDAAGLPGVAPPTAIVPGQLSGPTYGARDLTGERLGQLAGYEQDCAAAMSAGMGAEDDRRTGYERPAVSPPGDTIGSIMTLPPSPLDPGVGSLGTTEPYGWFYDPPRPGAPETFTGPGSQPG